MSNSNMDKQKHSSEQANGDQAAYLDSLIAQFDDNLEPELATDGKAEPIKPATPKSEESPSQSTTPEKEKESVATSEAPTILLITFAIVAVLGGSGWLLLKGSDETHTATEITQPDTPTATTHQTAALTTDMDSISSPPTTTVPEPVIPPASASKQKSTTTRDIDTDLASHKATIPKPTSAGVAWAVNLTSVATLAAARQIQEGLDSRKIKTELIKVTVGKKSFYRIRIPGFSSKQEAERARLPFLKEREFGRAWAASYHEKSVASDSVPSAE